MKTGLVYVLLLIVTTVTSPTFARPVALELVLAVDTSTSVDTEEFQLQRDGFAAAFRHPDLISIIEGMGDSGIAVTIIEWAGTGDQKIVVDWTLLTDRRSSLLFANRIGSAPRYISGMTDIGSALNFSTHQLETNAYHGSRRVIDVSGDGSSSASDTEKQRDIAISRGITINGLVIFNEEYDLGVLAEIDLIEHYSKHVIGGNGAFLMTAESFIDFREAIRIKLIREILGTGTATLTAN